MLWRKAQARDAQVQGGQGPQVTLAGPAHAMVQARTFQGSAQGTSTHKGSAQGTSTHKGSAQGTSTHKGSAQGTSTHKGSAQSRHVQAETPRVRVDARGGGFDERGKGGDGVRGCVVKSCVRPLGAWCAHNATRGVGLLLMAGQWSVGNTHRLPGVVLPASTPCWAMRNTLSELGVHLLVPCLPSGACCTVFGCMS